jgi:hypothetical protein
LKLLLDNCVHRAVKGFFPGHETTTAFQAGLARLENGDLLVEAAKSFDVLVTTDKNIRSQNLPPRIPASKDYCRWHLSVWPRWNKQRGIGLSVCIRMDRWNCKPSARRTERDSATRVAAAPVG